MSKIIMSILEGSDDRENWFLLETQNFKPEVSYLEDYLLDRRFFKYLRVVNFYDDQTIKIKEFFEEIK